VIERDWFEIKRYALTQGGFCPECGTAIAGRFGSEAEHFGARRIPVSLTRPEAL
jgi:pyruvate formate lyase activating enzyme